MAETPQEFGEEIRRERELREVSLKQLAAVTKVSQRHLEALESGRFDQLPAPVFSRGFLKACAEHLGLDGEKLAAAFTHTYDEWAAQNKKREETGVHPSDQWRLSRPRRAVSTSTTVMGLGVALALAIVTGTAALLKSRLGEKPPATSSAAAPKTSKGESGAASLSLPDSVAASTFALAPGAGAPLTGGVEHNAAEPPLTAPSRVAPSRPAAPGQKTLTLTFHDDCWTEVSADGKVVAAELFHKGTTQEFQAKRFTLTLGNAGGVDVAVDGRAMPSLGGAGQVVRNHVIEDR